MDSCTPFRRAAAALGATFLAACGSTGGGGGTPTVAIEPMCTILMTHFSINPKVDSALVADRTDPSVNHGFTRFRQISNPRGNSTVGFKSDVYGISEAWSRNSAGPVVVRAQAHPARRPQAGDFEGSAWSFNAQDVRGVWTAFPAGTLAFGATTGLEQTDDPATANGATPRLMTVGDANPQVFACAGRRSEDSAVRSTWLIEVTAPNAAAGTTGSVSFIQDLLNGDDRFVPNQPVGPLGGLPAANRPTPEIRNRPGHPVTQGSVRCAMTQAGDDVSTRELHMLTISNGALYHSMASNFGPTVTNGGAGITFNRFRNVSPWAEVGPVLGGGFGNIVDATIVASRPTAVSVFFTAGSGNAFKVWHAVRFSAGGGSWRAADDVLALNGGRPGGSPSGLPFRVAAGMCPVSGRPQDTELVYTLWNSEHRGILLGRMVSTPQTWMPGMTGTWSPLFDLSKLISGSSQDAERQATIQELSIVARPFRDNATPPTPSP